MATSSIPQFVSRNFVGTSQRTPLRVPIEGEDTKVPPGGGFGPKPVPIENGAVVSSEPARAQFSQDVSKLQQREGMIAPPIATAQPISGITPAPEKKTEAQTPTIPQAEGAITFKSPNAAFQSLIDQTNKILGDAKSRGIITPEIQDAVNQINNFELQKTQAVASARDATEKQDPQLLNEAVKKAEDIEAAQKDITTQLIEKMGKAQLDFLEARTPSERETELRRNLQTLRTERQLLPLELRQQGISATGIQAGQIEDERVRAIQESNLLFELGLEQEARQRKIEGAQAEFGFIQDDINLQLKIKDILNAEQEKITEEARTLRKESLSALSTIIDQFSGLAFEDMDAQTQTEVLEMAKQFNIPPALLSSALKNEKQQKIYSRATTKKEVQQQNQYYDIDGNALTPFQAARSIIEANPNASDEDLIVNMRENIPDLTDGDVSAIVKARKQESPPATPESESALIKETFDFYKGLGKETTKQKVESDMKQYLGISTSGKLPDFYQKEIDKLIGEEFGSKFLRKAKKIIKGTLFAPSGK